MATCKTNFYVYKKKKNALLAVKVTW